MTITPDNALAFMYLAVAIMFVGLALFFHATYRKGSSGKRHNHK